MPHKILNQIEQQILELKSQSQNCLVVFDLDSTLFDVSPRLQQILLDFAAKEDSQHKFPMQISLFKNIKTLPTDWGIRGALERAGIDDLNIDHTEFRKAVTEFWIENFFSNYYLQFDRPIEGAIEFVNEIASAEVDIAYLTGRDVKRMGIGSDQILRKWGLPLNEKSKLYLKPDKSMDDAEFKTDWFLEALSKPYGKIFFFENEPVILHKMNERCPQVECVFLESTHSGKAHPPTHLPKLKSFLRPKKDKS